MENSGINSDYLTQDLIWDADVWARQVKTRKVTADIEVETAVETLTGQRSSEIGLIYNLIRKMLLLQIEGSIPDVDAMYYNDGQVSASIREVFGTGDTVTFRLEPDPAESPHADTSQSFTKISWPGMTRQQASVIWSALSQLSGDFGVPLAASSPLLCEHISFPVRPSLDRSTWWNSLNVVRSTLRLLVETGRLYNQFEVALHAVCQTCSHFRADTPEAAALMGGMHVLQLPIFTTFRFGVPGALSGNMGGVRPSALSAFNRWITTPNLTWILSATLRSLAYYQSGVSTHEDRIVKTEVMRECEQDGVSSGVGVWLAYASQALGQKLSSPMATPFGADIGDYDTAVRFSVWGETSELNVVARRMTRHGEQVDIKPWKDNRRLTMQPRLMYALGLLPRTRYCEVTRQAIIGVWAPRGNDDYCTVRHGDLAAYLAMSDSLGWDVLARVDKDRWAANWSDFRFGLELTTAEMIEYPNRRVPIVDARKRGLRSLPNKLTPYHTGTYQYEMCIEGIGTAYSNGKAIAMGAFPCKTVKIPAHVRESTEGIVARISRYQPTTGDCENMRVGDPEYTWYRYKGHQNDRGTCDLMRRMAALKNAWLDEGSADVMSDTDGRNHAIDCRQKYRKPDHLLNWAELAAPPLLLTYDAHIADGNTWQYVYVGDVTYPAGWNYARIDGDGFWMYVVRLARRHCAYVSSMHVGSGHRIITQRVVAIARGLIRPVISTPTVPTLMGLTGSKSHIVTVAREGKNILQGADHNELFPRTVISSGHHTHLLPTECLEACRRAGRLCDAWAITAILKKIEGPSQATYATWLAWVSTAPEEMVRDVVTALASLTFRDVADLTRYLKKVTVRAKQLQHSGRTSFTPMFELEVLINRGIGSVDWDAERRNRTELEVINIPENVVFESAIKILREGRVNGYKYRANSWDEWWATRWLHVPNGSAHPMGRRLNNQHQALRKNDGYGKKALLCSIDKMEFGALAALKP